VLLVVNILEVGVLPTTVIFLVVVFDHLAIVDQAAPGAGLDLLHLDEGLETG
jgi:hypothetical protein